MSGDFAMRPRSFGWLLLALAPSLGGCAGASHTAEGAGVGALLGTGTGALLGSATGHTGAGALLGLGAGTLIGGAIGNENDRRERDSLVQAKNEAEARSQQGSPMGMTDVIQLARQNVGDEVIINQMRSTRSTFQLSTEDIRSLKENGVSDRVIVEMQNRRPETAPRYVPYHARPRYYYGPPPPVLIYEAPPPPPPGNGVGFVVR